MTLAAHYLRLIDRQTTGNRCDVTPLFADASAFATLLGDLSSQLDQTPFDAIAALDALGFILGAGLAVTLQKGLITMRKGGKLPVQTAVAEFVDYTGTHKSLEIRPDAIRPGMRLLLVDEWVETGAQIQAAISLIERCNGKVVGIASINIDPEARRGLEARGFKYFAVSDH